MFATTDDLKMSSRNNAQPQQGNTLSKAQATSYHQRSHNKPTRSHPSSSDSSDEIQVLEEQQVAIPIRHNLDRRQSDRHSDLDIGSVHSRKRRSSPLFERRRRDDLDLLTDSLDSSDDEYNGRMPADANVRGRGRRTKPLLQPKQQAPLQREQPFDYDFALRKSHHHHEDRDCFSPEGRRPLSDLLDTPKHHTNHTQRSRQARAKQHQLSPPVLAGLEHEAMVFDNFEDVSPVSSASEQEQENKDPFDTHLHFVRPAMPICANAGAFVALEPIVTPGGSSKDGSEENLDDEQAAAQRKRHRLGHHRAVSELFVSPSSCARAADVRATRRRATVGSEAAYRLSPFTREADLSA